MKLINSVKLTLAMLSAAIRATSVNTNWKIAGELMAAVPERTDMLNLLRDLSKMKNTLAEVSDREMIIKLMDNTRARFSPEVNEKYGLTEEEVDQLVVKYMPTRSGSLQAAIAPLDVHTYVGVLSGYGCWCSYGNGSPKHGHGKAVDEIDDLCKSMQQAYECLRMDSQENTNLPFCDPTSVNYNFNIAEFLLVTNSYPTNSIADNCKASNPGDECAEHTCVIELTMLAEYKNGLLQDPNYIVLTIDDTYKHTSFDPEVECGTPGSMYPSYSQSANGANAGGNSAGAKSGGQGWMGATKKECCGVFPKRYPYNTGPEQDPIRGCCLDKTYSLKNDCCQNDVISFGCINP